jgi:hypothetical protein
MKMKFNKTILQTIAFFAIIALTACNKDTTGAEVDLSYKMLADKTWYLEYAQTTNSTSTTTKNYVGQSTYFINFLKNLSTNDSDGLTGTYTVQKVGNKLQIVVQAKTGSNNISNYNYEVVSLGTKDMVLSFTNNTSITKYYYSTQK